MPDLTKMKDQSGRHANVVLVRVEGVRTDEISLSHTNGEFGTVVPVVTDADANSVPHTFEIILIAVGNVYGVLRLSEQGMDKDLRAVTPPIELRAGHVI